MEEKLKNLESSIKNGTLQDDGLNMEDKSKIPIGNWKLTFRQSSVNYQSSKLRVHINGFVIVDFVDMGIDMIIITPDIWQQN